MQTYIVKFIPNDNSPTIVHRIKMPDFNEKGFYRSRVSWNGFCTGKRKGATRIERKTNRDGCVWSLTGLFYTHDGREDMWLDTIKRRQDFYLQMKDISKSDRNGLIRAADETRLPTVEHESLDAFYQHIGFDRKARKYRA